MWWCCMASDAHRQGHRQAALPAPQPSPPAPPSDPQWMAPSTCSSSEKYDLFEVPLQVRRAAASGIVQCLTTHVQSL